MSVMLTMDLKLEPSSPSASLDAEVTWLNEDTLLFPLDQDDFIKHDDFKLEPELFIGDSKAEVASQILENLENLVDLDELIKEDSFFLDVKGIPLLEDVEAPQAVPVVNKDYFKSSDTQTIFNDISSVYGVYKHDTLTPPQSPPSEQPTFLNLEPQGPNFFTLQPSAKAQINPVIVYNVPVGESKTLQPLYSDAKQLYAPEYPAVVTPNPDIAHELAVVDELVRTRVADLQWNNGPSSPSSYTSSCSNSSFGDSSDHEWSPDTAEQSSGSESSAKKGSKKRKTPYARSTEDKKSRKKEQNKNAATRYRLKKKAEVEEILTEEKQLAKHGDELNIKITDLQREIKYLKSLMRDLFKAKGIIN